MPIKIFLFLIIFLFSFLVLSTTNCRDSLNGIYQYAGFCHLFQDSHIATPIAEFYFHFDSISQLFPFFLKVKTLDGGKYSYPAICNEDYFFPEAWNECLIWWQNQKYNGYDMKDETTGQTEDIDGKYFIPYCFTMKNIYLYRIIGLGEGKSFELVDVIPWERQIESAKFFGKYLVLIDVDYINILELKGQKLYKVANYFFPHPPEKYHFVDTFGNKLYNTIDNYLLDYPFLFIFLESKLEGYGSIVTFKIQNKKIELIDNGMNLCYSDSPLRLYFNYSKINGKTYIGYRDYIHYTCFYKVLENGLLSFLFTNSETASCETCTVWKDEYMYTASPYVFYSVIAKFTEEKIDYKNSKILDMRPAHCSDTECINGNQMIVNCFYDELPEVKYEILPDKPVSQNFLVTGTAYDSEGIRGVFSGSVYPYLWKAERFKREDGTVWWMAKMEEEPFKIVEKWGWAPGDCKDNGSPLITIAEDSDLDTNMSFDNPYNKDLRCIKVKEEKDPLPFGYLDLKPKENDRVLNFSGWALDNSGISKGWLFSEDANVLLEINYGIERGDVKEKYPQYPDSLHSGFSVSYDTGNLEDGVYEFTLRIMAKDFQVLDFGPFKIKIEKKHQRPF